MKKAMFLLLVCLSSTVLATPTSGEPSASSDRKADYFAQTKARALDLQSKRLTLLQREQECTSRANNRLQLRACVKQTQDATQALHEKHLAQIRQQYSLNGR